MAIERDLSLNCRKSGENERRFVDLHLRSYRIFLFFIENKIKKAASFGTAFLIDVSD